jgi:hypothetical protein
LAYPWLLGNRGIVRGVPCGIIVKNDAEMGNAPLARCTGVSLRNAFGLVRIGTRCRRCLLCLGVAGGSKYVVRVKRRTALGGNTLVRICESGWESLEVALVHPCLIGNRGIGCGVPSDPGVRIVLSWGMPFWLCGLISAGDCPWQCAQAVRGVDGICCVSGSA